MLLLLAHDFVGMCWALLARCGHRCPAALGLSHFARVPLRATRAFLLDLACMLRGAGVKGRTSLLEAVILMAYQHTQFSQTPAPERR